MLIKSRFLRYPSVVRVWAEDHSSLMFWGVLAIIVTFGMVQAAVRLRFNLNVDEPFTAYVVHFPLAEIAKFYKDDVTPAYYIALKGWVVIFGESEAALRSISVLAFGLTTLIIGTSARWVNGRLGGLLAALLVSTSSLEITHASTARAYAILGLVVSIATLLYLYYLMQSSMRLNIAATQTVIRTNWLLWTAITSTSTVGLLTHPTYLFFLGACVLTTFLMSRSRRTFCYLATSSVVSLCIYLALMYTDLSMAFYSPSTHWMSIPSLHDLWESITQLWASGMTIVLGICLALVLSLYLYLKKGVRSPCNQTGLLCIGVIVLACLVPFLVSQVRPVFYGPRTLVLILPMACIFVAYLVTLPPTWLTKLIVAGLVVGEVTPSIQNAIETALSSDPHPVRQSVQSVLEQASCEDTFILGGLSYAEVDYYLRRLNVPSDCIRRETYPLDTASHLGWIDVPTLQNHMGQMLNEAKATVSRLSTQAGSQVWLFNNKGDYGQPVTDIIQQQLDCQMVSTRTLDVRGTWFNSVILYTNREPGAGSAPCK